MTKAILAIVSLMFATSASAPFVKGQSLSQAPKPEASAASVQSKLSEAEQKLVRGSRAAVVGAGISERYFDEHFTLLKIFNTPGDRRVIWRFRVNGHEALVSDTIGFYTEAGGRRVDTHSITSARPSAHDITRTITRRRAEAIMRSCIGAFSGGTVIYHLTGTPGRASLVFTATSIPKRKSRAELAREEREHERREEREREEKARARKRAGQGNAQHETDVTEEEDEGGGPPIFIGSVDLETGRCAKGLALSGPARPNK